MNWHPQTSQSVRQERATLLHELRTFFFEHQVLEVETPALSQSGNTDPYIESFQLNQQHQNRYLHTSPEYPMKRLLAASAEDIYQICKVWRKGESGKNHNPEFTLLEWYRVGFSYHQLIEEVSQLLHLALPNTKKAHQIFTYEALFLENFTLNPHIASRSELIACVNQNIESLSTQNLGKQDLLDALLTHCIEPSFDKGCLTFIIDYPASQSALARTRKETNYSVAERFEVYLGETELGNGYQEETDFARNQEILENENKARVKNQLETVPQDTYFLEATKNNIPFCAGVALGVDRILMLRCGIDSIQKVINFPWDVA